MGTAEATRRRLEGGPARIRRAEPRDLARLWALVREFAAFERLEHLATGSPERLGENLFGRGWPALDCVVAEVDGQLAGFALYYGVYSTFWTRPMMWLEDLFVTESHRGRGLGSALFEAVARAAAERGCARMDWAVLDWNTPAMEFYQRLGATRHDGWQVFRLGEDQLLEFLRKRG